MWTLKNDQLVFDDGEGTVLHGMTFELMGDVYGARLDSLPMTLVDVDTPYGPKLLALITASSEADLNDKFHELELDLGGRRVKVYLMRPKAQLAAMGRHLRHVVAQVVETSGRNGHRTLRPDGDGGLDVDTRAILTNVRHALSVIELTDDPTRLNAVLTDAEAFSLYSAGLGPRLLWTMAEAMRQSLQGRFGNRAVNLPDPTHLDTTNPGLVDDVPERSWSAAAWLNRSLVVDELGTAPAGSWELAQHTVSEMADDMTFEELAGTLLLMLTWFAAALRAIPQK